MHKSGLPDVLSSLQRPIVYVGVSAGAMVAAPTFAESYTKPHRGTENALTREDMTFPDGESEVLMNFITAKGAGFTDFAMIVHANHKDRPDASFDNAPKWATKLSVPQYAIDDDTLIKVIDGSVEVIT